MATRLLGPLLAALCACLAAGRVGRKPFVPHEEALRGTYEYDTFPCCRSDPPSNSRRILSARTESSGDVTLSGALLRLDRSDQDDVRVYAVPDWSSVAVSYEDDDAPYALASLHIEDGDGGACLTRAIAQRSSSGFLGLAPRCWSWWSSHFESSDEVDPAMDHVALLYSRSEARSSPKAVLVVEDLFYRRVFALDYTANCLR